MRPTLHIQHSNNQHGNQSACRRRSEHRSANEGEQPVDDASWLAPQKSVDINAGLGRNEFKIPEHLLEFSVGDLMSPATMKPGLECRAYLGVCFTRMQEGEPLGSLALNLFLTFCLSHRTPQDHAAGDYRVSERSQVW